MKSFWFKFMFSAQIAFGNTWGYLICKTHAELYCSWNKKPLNDQMITVSHTFLRMTFILGNKRWQSYYFRSSYKGPITWYVKKSEHIIKKQIEEYFQWTYLKYFSLEQYPPILFMGSSYCTFFFRWCNCSSAHYLLAYWTFGRGSNPSPDVSN